MSSENEDILETLKDNIPTQKIEDVNICFFDLSTACTGYTNVNINFNTKKAKFLSCGAIWFPKDYKNMDKYHYMYRAITTYFDIVQQISFCICERYSINMSNRSGCLVGPELHGSIQTALAEIGVGYLTIAPQTWRSQLDIKKDKSNNDFKEPTKEKILEFLEVPEKITSNITKNERKTPNDIYDSLGIALGFLKKININNFDFSDIKFQEHVGVID